MAVRAKVRSKSELAEKKVEEALNYLEPSEVEMFRWVACALRKADNDAEVPNGWKLFWNWAYNSGRGYVEIRKRYGDDWREVPEFGLVTLEFLFAKAKEKGWRKPPKKPTKPTKPTKPREPEGPKNSNRRDANDPEEWWITPDDDLDRVRAYLLNRLKRPGVLERYIHALDMESSAALQFQLNMSGALHGDNR